MATKNDDNRQQLSLNGRPIGLRRQPTKYPHGLCVNVQHVGDHANVQQNAANQNEQQQPQRCPTNLRSKTDNSRSNCPQTDENAHRKYKISMINNPENLTNLQVRRYKYPMTGNYYLDAQEPTTKASLALLEYAQTYCRWKYLRWPSIFVASVLLFFGVITYCIWLHDVSVAREQYLKRKIQNAATEDFRETDAVISQTESTIAMTQSTSSPTTIRSHRLQESTLLRAIGTQRQQRPYQQKLTTQEYVASKGAIEWQKQRKESATKASLPTTTTTETPGLIAEEAILAPESVLRFTSGHQNSFGIPIEEDERILGILNRLFSSNHPVTSPSNSIAKVSPTIPPVITPTSAMSTGGTTVQESGCYSTRLPMCRGVLEYDLTNNSTIELDGDELKAYQQLIRSNCSARAVEFICSTLEPECRPSHIGVLPPCRRICKAILEACSIIIANSDTLSSMFDCNLYPDSNDPHKCEDPTRRRGYCYDNEYECYDRSCIPSQWQCDKIKDCASGEEEDDCLICESADEFRCHSNEKCISEALRCDLKYDCFDGSDEEDCDEYGSGEEPNFDVETLNSFPRVFSYASFLSPNQSNEKLYTYITATTDEESGTKFQVHEIKRNESLGVSKEEVTNSVPGEGPKGFVNFRESKEIMMTSDSENKFKYSSTHPNRTTPALTLPSSTTPLQPEGSYRVGITTELPKELNGVCAPHQLRCVSGKCITVAQLCDKKKDCPDGADELMCVYKERSRSTVKSIAQPKDTPTTARTSSRNVSTTFKRKVKS